MKTAPTHVFTQPIILKGWVARDKVGNLYLYMRKPIRGKIEWYSGFPVNNLPNNSMPNLTWDDEPLEVEININPKRI